MVIYLVTFDGEKFAYYSREQSESSLMILGKNATLETIEIRDPQNKPK